MTYAFHGQQIDWADIELAFVFSKNPPDLPGPQPHMFLPGTSAPVCSPTLFKTLGGKTTIKAILQDGLLHDTNIDGWHDWLLRTGTRPVPPLSGPVFEDFNLLHAAALAGEGVALCPLAKIRAELKTKRLIQLSPDTMNEDHSYYLIRRPSNESNTTDAANAFTNWLFETRNKEQQATTIA